MVFLHSHSFTDRETRAQLDTQLLRTWARTQTQVFWQQRWGLIFPYHFYFLIGGWKIALQFCVGFCHTIMQISHTHTHTHIYIYIHTHIHMYPFLLSPPFLPAPTSPLWVITEHQAGFPVLFSSFPFSVLHRTVCICQCYFFNLSHPHFPLEVHSSVGSSVPFF